MFNFLVFFLTLAGMEVAAALLHRHVMHGWGWRWHESHHRPRTGWFELNDCYAMVFAAIAIVLIALGTSGYSPLQWVGAGMTAYGLLYFLVHDGLVHRRLPLGITPRSGYLKRLYQAHLLHHAVHTKEGAVSFGFLYAQEPAQLKRKLAETKTAGRNGQQSEVQSANRNGQQPEPQSAGQNPHRSKT